MSSGPAWDGTPGTAFRASIFEILASNYFSKYPREPKRPDHFWHLSTNTLGRSAPGLHNTKAKCDENFYDDG